MGGIKRPKIMLIKQHSTSKAIPRNNNKIKIKFIPHTVHTNIV